MSLIKNLKMKYEGFEIDIPQWEIFESEINILWGKSGSGKTTCLRLLLGLEKTPYDWVLKGVDIGKLSVSEKRIGIVFQAYDLFPHLSGKENILFALDARGIPRNQVKEKLEIIARKLNLKSFWDRKAKVLSGGEQQRIALVRAIIASPRLLFLDEPFSALDPEFREESRILVKDLIVSEGLTTILITHDLNDVRILGDQVAEIVDGKIIRQKAKDKFISQF